MARQLTDIVLDELSLVDDGANELARVVIAKRKGTSPQDPPHSNAEAGDVAKLRIAMLQHLPDFAAQLVAKAMAASPAADPNAAALAAASITENFMDLQELSAALEKAEADNAVLKARAEAAEKLNTTHEATITKMKGDLETVQKGRMSPEQEDEAFMKALPESVRTRLLAERAATTIALDSVEKMRAEKDTAESIAKARSLGVAEPEIAGPLLSRVAKGKTTAEDAVALETILKAAAEQVKAGDLLKTAGIHKSKALDASDPDAELQAKAQEIQKAKPGTSAAKAMELAMEQNPALYDAYIAKRRG